MLELETATPQSQPMSSEALNRLIQYSNRISDSNGLIMMRNDKNVLEHYLLMSRTKRSPKRYCGILAPGKPETMIRPSGMPHIFLNSPTMMTPRFRPSIIGFNSRESRSRPNSGNPPSNLPKISFFQPIGPRQVYFLGSIVSRFKAISTYITKCANLFLAYKHTFAILSFVESKFLFFLSVFDMWLSGVRISNMSILQELLRTNLIIPKR